jgi:polyhydroxyalkanoate synthesis regulator phasin
MEIERSSSNMNKGTLKGFGLTDEQADKVMKELDGAFIPKSRFNEVNAELKQAKEAVTERDKQLEDLKKSTGDVEALKKQIEDLQTANKTQTETHAAEMKTLKFDTALHAALSGAKARNPETVKPLLRAFLEKAEMDGDSIKGLDAELKKLTESEDTKFLFNADGKPPAKPPFRGMTPGEPNKDGDAKPATLGEAIKAKLEAQITT